MSRPAPFRQAAAGILLVFLLASHAVPAGQGEAQAGVQTAWRLLDYIAVDYAGAVQGGRVASAGEYAEQQEFAAAVAGTLAALPVRPEQAGLQAGVARLQAAIDAKADPAEVTRLARTLAAGLLAAYPVPVAPVRPPDLARGQALYAQHCASCHGGNGDGRGPAAASLEVPPIAFTDLGRARQRSLFGLYQAITQGIDGTAMASFAGLPDDDRWALAFYAGQFAFPEVEAGRR